MRPRELRSGSPKTSPPRWEGQARTFALRARGKSGSARGAKSACRRCEAATSWASTRFSSSEMAKGWSSRIGRPVASSSPEARSGRRAGSSSNRGASMTCRMFWGFDDRKDLHRHGIQSGKPRALAVGCARIARSHRCRCGVAALVALRMRGGRPTPTAVLERGGGDGVRARAAAAVDHPEANRNRPRAEKERPLGAAADRSGYPALGRTAGGGGRPAESTAGASQAAIRAGAALRAELQGNSSSARKDRLRSAPKRPGARGGEAELRGMEEPDMRAGPLIKVILLCALAVPSLGGAAQTDEQGLPPGHPKVDRSASSPAL